MAVRCVFCLMHCMHTQGGITALHAAALVGNVEAVKLLLRHKCKVTVKDKV